MIQASQDTDNRSPIVKAEKLGFSFGARPIFRDLNLEIPRGKITVILGPSGCGKSTFLSLLGGRLRPTAGTLEFNGRAIPKKGDALIETRKQMGMLFQNSALLTDLDVFENVAFPFREQTDLPDELIHILVLMKLEMVGLRGARDLMPSQLSGGMARRVSLARAIALDPDLIMYDEPFVGLDPVSMGVIVKLIEDLNQALDITSIVVTHDVEEGCSIADHVCLFDGGIVAGQGTPEEMMQSDDPGIRQFMRGLPDGPVGFHYPAGEYLQDLGAKQ